MEREESTHSLLVHSTSPATMNTILLLLLSVSGDNDPQMKFTVVIFSSVHCRKPDHRLQQQYVIQLSIFL